MSYGVASRSTRQEEGTPSCSCPCHLAKWPPGATQWYCDRCATITVCSGWTDTEPVTYPHTYSHTQAVKDGEADPQPYMVCVVDYWFITEGPTLAQVFPRRRFRSREAAEAAADALNAMVTA